MILASLMLAAALAHDLNLTCAGSTMTRDGAAVSLHDSTGYSASATASGSGSQNIPFTVRFRMKAGEAQVNVPASATGGASGDAGWFKVKKLSITDDEIAGTVRFGLWSSSRFSIDRRTGVMTTGSGFSGACHKEDDHPRAF